MSDVREVSEWHDAMEGTMTVAGERMQDAINDLVEALRLTELMNTIVLVVDIRTWRRP